MIEKLEYEHVDQALLNPKAVLLFTTTYCGNCKMLISQLKTDPVLVHNKDVTLSIVDITEVTNEKIFNVKGCPTIIKFEDGKEIGRISGFVTVKMFNEFVYGV